MNKKLLALTMASTLSLNTFTASANLDRTAGIGEAQVAQGRQQYKKLQMELQQLDSSLLKTSEAIKKRDQQGSLLGASTVVGAALGVGLTAFASMSLHRGVEGSGIAALLSGMLGLAVTATSAGLGTGAIMAKDKIDTDVLEAQINGLEKQVAKEKLNIQSKVAAEQLFQVEKSLERVRENLLNYKNKANSIEKNKLISTITQAAGAALTFYSLTQKRSAMAQVGPMLMAAGSIGQIVSRLSDDQADSVQQAIEQLRSKVATAVAALE